MRKKCPNCGNWCEAEERGFIEKAVGGFSKSAEKATKIGASIGSIFGKSGEKIGAYLGGAVSGGTGLAYLHAATDAIAGDEYVYKCDSCGYEWTADIEEVIDGEDELDAAINEYLEKIDKIGDTDEAIEYANQNISQFPENSIELAYAYATLGELYRSKGDDESALKCFFNSAASESVEYGSELYGNVCYQIYSCYVSLDNLIEARKWSVFAARFANNTDIIETIHNGQITAREDAEIDLTKMDDEYTAHFLNIPYKDRKVLLIVDGFSSLFQNNFVTLDIDSDLSQLSFPIGHPKVNEMYIAHPLMTNRYVPIEDYQLELVEDRVREFCELSQGLGAIEINIECLNKDSNDTTNSVNRNLSGGLAKDGNSIHASGHDEYSRRLIEEISRSVSLHQTFQPHKAPALPKNLLWYNGEPSWQRLYRQRMEGGLLTHEERIETKKSQVVDNREMKEIKGELETLFANMDVAFDKTEEAKFEQQENAVLAISVKFAPLSQLAGEATNQQTSMYTANEQQYIDEVKECLADGEITKTGRRLLNMQRERLGISESRAAELEASVSTPQLTDEEKEYLEAYREACEDGQISENERRMLNRLRDMLGITEERAREIEK